MYNAEKHIVQCLDSISNQSLRDIEIIIVDDKSTDDSAIIVENYIQKNQNSSKIKLFKQEINQGPGIARNIGIQNANGEYVAFLDSDDWVENETYNTLYMEAQKHNAELCYCNAIMDFSNGETRIITNPKVTNGDFSIEEKRAFLTNFVTYCVTYLYQRNFLVQNKITFPTGRSSEDSVFLTKCILNCSKIAALNEIFYHYVINQNSLTQSHNPERYKDKLKNFNLIISERDKHKIYADEIGYIFIKKGIILSIINYIRDSREVNENTIAEIYHILITAIPDFRNNKYYRQDYKCRMLLFCLSKAPRISAIAISTMFKWNPRKKSVA